MTDDTLSQVAELPDVFDRNIVRTRMKPADRYAMSMVHGERDQALQATVREIIMAGLEALGWPEDLRIERYAKYQVECIRTGTLNEFEVR